VSERVSRRDAPRWVLWLGTFAAATAGMFVLRRHLDKAHVALVYLLVVLGASAGGGRALGFTVAGAAFLAFNFLLLPPYYTLTLENPFDWLVLLAFFVTSVVATQLLHRAQRAEREAAERRLEALRSALLMSVSHDLRTPLTTIKGIAHEIAHGAPPTGAEVIEVEADRLDALIGDLLDLSRIQAGAVRPHLAVNTADELIGAALDRAAGALRGREVVADVPNDALLSGRFDFTQTLRVLVNLLENAAKYAPAGTPLDVRARHVGDRLTIAVLDRGPGVPEAERERIFEPFYRPPNTSPDVRGTGLGLSIARGLAEAQGGHVRYEPRAGGGSAFVVDLPAVDVAMAEVPEDET
jgi:two-component system sensor histidine kinase KdpD